MDIKEAEQKKRELEDDLYKRLVQFEKETGLFVEDVDITVHQIYTCDSARLQALQIEKCSVKVRLI